MRPIVSRRHDWTNVGGVDSNLKTTNRRELHLM